jgi:drug/metabolite transporter (DMT)-like permease
VNNFNVQIMKNTQTAVFFALLATFGFSVQDAVVKLLSNSGSLWQLMLLRAIIVVVLLIVWSKTFGRASSIRPKGWLWPTLRAVFMSAAYTLFYGSLPLVSLSEAAACFFSGPIFICLFSAIFLKESIGFWRIGAVLFGFIGVLLIIQPGGENVRVVLILPLMAGSFYAMGVIVTRGWCKDEPTLSLTISHNLFYACLGALIVTFLPLFSLPEGLLASNRFMMTGWVPLTREVLLLIGITSITHIIAMTASIRAYQLAETSFIAPIEYIYLIFAIAIDFFIWKTLPDITGILGVSMIIASGIVITLRERLKQKSD